MELQNGRSYRAPDGRIFIARLEHRRYATEPAWVFIPTDLKSAESLRDSLERSLFMESGKIGFFDFSGAVPAFVDSGWRPADFAIIQN